MTLHPANSSLSLDERAATEARARASLGISGGDSHYAWTVRGIENEIRRGGAILDLGCGVGLFGRFLQQHFGVRPHGLDVVRHDGFHEGAYASFALQNLETVRGDGQRFDLIFAIGLIEYFPNPRAFFQTLPALLLPGGRVIITAPNPASWLSLISLVRRGDFSAFRESSNPASITPVLAVDAARMMREAGLMVEAADFSGRGRVPLTHGMNYQQVLPFLRGRLWSDNFRLVARAGQ